jgi:hypothetical protein
MRLLIVSTKARLAGYSEFSEALDSLGVETVWVNDSKYCSLSESKRGRYTAIVQIPLINTQKLLGYSVNIVGTQNICKAVDKNPITKGLILTGTWHTIGARAPNLARAFARRRYKTTLLNDFSPNTRSAISTISTRNAQELARAVKEEVEELLRSDK